MISSLTGERGFIEIFVLNIFEIHSICTSTGIDFQARVLVFISTSAWESFISKYDSSVTK